MQKSWECVPRHTFKYLPAFTWTQTAARIGAGFSGLWHEGSFLSNSPTGAAGLYGLGFVFWCLPFLINPHQRSSYYGSEYQEIRLLKHSNVPRHLFSWHHLCCHESCQVCQVCQVSQQQHFWWWLSVLSSLFQSLSALCNMILVSD